MDGRVELEVTIELATELSDDCYQRQSGRLSWFRIRERRLAERVVRVLDPAIKCLTFHRKKSERDTRKICELESDLERLRSINRDREAQIAGLKKRVAELEERRQNANGHLAECRTLHTKLSEAMSNARRETHAFVELEASE